MEEAGRKRTNINCGCSCFGCLTAVVSFVILCYLCNCQWAKDVVHRCIRDVTSAVCEGEK